jgi:hypothetical protein
MALDLVYYPVSITEDRYQGAYSRGKWIAIASADEHLSAFHEGESLFCLGPWGGDRDAARFWNDPPNWIAAGATPNEALAALESKLMA